MFIKVIYNCIFYWTQSLNYDRKIPTVHLVTQYTCGTLAQVQMNKQLWGFALHKVPYFSHSRSLDSLFLSIPSILLFYWQ